MVLFLKSWKDGTLRIQEGKIDDAIDAGLAYLFGCQNADGGIACTVSGQPSGIWTSAETLEAAVRLAAASVQVNFNKIHRLTRFLVESQFSSGVDYGGCRLCRIFQHFLVARIQ